MAEKKYTPMMQHYLKMKEENPDAILFYRLGDFYEMFFDDAKLVSQELDLVLTGRSAGVEEKVPMCGVPFHAANSYISRLVKKGYKVAICEQLEDPSNAKGLVDRGIVKIVTPGTYMDSTMDAKTTNYMASCDISSFEITVVYCELSTGELKYQTLQRSLVALQKALLEQNVSELVCPMAMDKKWMSALEEMETILISKHKKSSVDSQDLPLLNGIESESLKEAFALLMAYLKDTQKQHIDHFLPIESMDKDKVLVMDYETKNHLELVSSQSTNAKAESLWSFMDKCQSAMGSRLLKRWIEYPLIDAKKIAKRQAAIKDLKENFMLRENLKEHLVYVYDMERLASRMAYGSASPRDVLQLVATLEHAKPILDLAISLDSYPEFSQVPDCQELYNEIKNAIVENPPLTLKEGGVFNDGYNQELDEVRRIAKKGKDFILELEAKERERTGVKSLKVGYNRIFGYFIEVRNGNLSNIKDEFGYHAKQTLANATRFVTQELKEKEEQILHAQETKVKLEQSLFNDLLLRIKKDLFDLHACAQALSTIDVLVSLAILASEKGYVCPVFHPGYNVNVVEGKHPILDDRMKKKRYVSNDWKMSEDEHVQLITGPNMGGKSTYMRQNALLVVMAQMGSFIPAKTAELPIFDRIFTRIGASDDILTGKSTFMVEMMEANAALCYATKHSLILFDEIGRGTATYDGMALAQAMLEYIDEAIGAKTLFSTHYHELTDLEKEHPSMHNVHVDVREEKNEIEFRYRIIDGKADKSYGINVARLAHLPKVVLDRAAQLLTNFENQDNNQNYQPSLFVMEQVQPEKSKLLQQLQELDIDSMTPRDALDCLYELKKLSEKIEL
ncbi:MAG: DNA mismatch repair protein MutS [Holdemanella biformis]|jgi:DNA mismatch repair protein MutS|uniref:DNA mismatch repair protein MutS n=1 Tax=Holdemanella biformis TaxID=1735 RepID=UPI001C38FEA2|nr:DNA mismatch repair protein MutS [Holdemanella biformis]MBD8958085.1 DNA mismatch repair protein MutS [Holdemanella biformis]MBS6454826.1 DNA mismatch repair protein MutS [Holdemanella biformis]MBV4130952.1 DNA mismatch repair protein MutS [Holdemanella biformis]MBV4150690.1 DNA mismatch repair protein MutS [Holdemanella biformis]